MAVWENGQVTAAQLDAAIRELPMAKRQPGPEQSFEDWVGDRATELALPEVLLERTRQTQMDERPALELRARYLASQEAGRTYLTGRCPEETLSEDELAALFAQSSPKEPRAWVLVRHIYKRAPLEARAAERQAVRGAITELRRELEAGASFIELARLHSDSETAKEGGLIGRLSEQAPIEERVRDAAWALADGEYSDVVEVTNGFHIVLRERSGVTPPPTIEQVRDELQGQEAQRRREACGAEVLAELGRATAVTVDRGALLDLADGSRPALTIGDEQFSAKELAGLSPDLTPLTLTPRPGELLRHFSEAVLLARAVESEDSGVARYAAAEARELRRLLAEAQWRRERRKLFSTRPEEELRAYFAEHRERFLTDLELDVGLILVPSLGEPGRRPAMERAQLLRRRLVEGESFEELARAASAHSSREAGGRLGSLPLPRLTVVLGSRGIVGATELGIGDISEPVQIQDPPTVAFALLKLYGRTEPQPRSFEDAREDVIDTLGQERVQQLDREVREHLLAEAGFALRPDAIAAYVARLSE